MLRSTELCRGGDSGPGACEDSKTVSCQTCGTEWEPEDTNVPGRCPKCNGRYIVVNRCAGCPLEDLDWVRTHSRAGQLLDRVVTLEFDCEKFAVPWEAVTAEERWGLQILAEERAKKQKEDQDEQQREHALQMAARR